MAQHGHTVTITQTQEGFRADCQEPNCRWLVRRKHWAGVHLSAELHRVVSAGESIQEE